VGAQSAVLWGEAWVGVVSFAVTLLILIFSEIIPKTLGAVHAKGLATFTTWTVHGMVLMLWPLVAVCNGISRGLTSGKQSLPAISREEISSLARLAHREGAIDHAEARVMRNLIALQDTTVGEVMTPRTVVFTLHADQTVREATDGEPPSFARVPVVGESPDDIKGVLHRRDLFKARNEGRTKLTLGELARSIHVVPEVAKLPAILEEFLKRHQHLSLVVDEYGGTAGIITLEDVLETLLGVEIIDETDKVEDMQELAKQLLAARRNQTTGSR
jgi:CBS domain containing-hemolysin-like protein